MRKPREKSAWAIKEGGSEKTASPPSSAPEIAKNGTPNAFLHLEVGSFFRLSFVSWDRKTTFAILITLLLALFLFVLL